MTICTYVMWAGILPSFGIGCLLSFLRLHYLRVTVVKWFKEAPEGTRSDLIYRFDDAREVEVMSRCCRKWMKGFMGRTDYSRLDPDAVKLSELVIKSGKAQLSRDPYMIILSSSFQIHVLKSYQSGYSELQVAKDCSPSFIENFAIFCREQEHIQRQSNADRGDSEGHDDLVSFVEFHGKSNHNLVRSTSVSLMQEG